MSFCSPHLSKYFEEAKHFVKLNKEKFEELFAFVKKNKKFPDFPDFPEDIRSYLLEFKFIQENGWNTGSYEENCKRLVKKKSKAGFDDEKMNEVFEDISKALKYQREYFVFPTNAQWFNTYSKYIFSYLKKCEA